MEWTEILHNLMIIVFIPLLGLITHYIIQFVHIQAERLKEQHSEELYQKYITMLDNTIANVVTATNQTYVDALKEQGKFDMEAQKEAFNATYTKVLAIIGIEAQNYLSNVIGDLNQYITNSIERQVVLNKIESY